MNYDIPGFFNHLPIPHFDKSYMSKKSILCFLYVSSQFDYPIIRTKSTGIPDHQFYMHYVWPVNWTGYPLARMKYINYAPRVLHVQSVSNMSIWQVIHGPGWNAHLSQNHQSCKCTIGFQTCHFAVLSDTQHSWCCIACCHHSPQIVTLSCSSVISWL